MSSSFRLLQATLTLAAVLGPVVGGCLYDPEERCGPAMIYVAEVFGCVCERNAVPVKGGCAPCADDEIVVGGKCGCAAGQSKNADNVCVAISGLGDACDTQSSPCNDATYSYCAPKGAGTAGTCTNECTSDTDCGAAYTCATWEPTPYCRLFEGDGAACTTSADCQGDARYCDTAYTHVCYVSGCSVADDDCPRGQQCCDYTSYGLGTLCGTVCL